MPTLLHLDSSADLTDSVSRRLTARFAAAWVAISAEHDVVRRDLHTDPLPHLPSHVLHWAAHLRTPGESAPADAEARQQLLIDEVASADVLVIGAPMYNWSMPSTLKAWIDYLHVPGTTAPFDTPTQPFAGKPVVVVSSRGDQYGPGTPNPDADHVLPALRKVLGDALGMAVTCVTAELTLADRIPAMAALRERAAADRRLAEQTLDELAAKLGADSGSAPA
jgi:FMN-dependent NADH-azoreductase